MPPRRRLLDRRAPAQPLRLFEALVTAILGILAGSASAQAQPNIIVIMSDDVGYNETGFTRALFGGASQFQTPNLDALASQSMVMRQAYSAAPLCSPSRFGLLTGQYQQRSGVEENLGNNLSQTWGYKGTETTLADRLKGLGYSTGLVGKYHNGYVSGVNRPNDMGFDEFFGFLSGNRQYFGEGAPSNFMMRNTTVVENQWRTQGNPATYDPLRGRYVTDALGDEAVDFINRHANDPNPFYLHAAFNANHDPFTAKQQDYDLFAHITNVEDRTQAAMLYAFDRNVGNMMNALQANGIASNTIVVYVNDNGGTHLHDNGALRGFKGYTWEGGIRVPMIVKAPGLAPGVFDHPVTMYDFVPTLVAAAGGSVAPEDVVGVDVMPYLTGAQTGDPHAGKPLFWRSQTIWAVRKGDWKLARPNEPFISVLSLYNLATDPSEVTNRVNQEPAIRDELLREFTLWEATLRKPEFGALGADDKNNFDHFVFRADPASVTNWNAANAWTQSGTATAKTLLASDAYANAVLEFTTRDNEDYTATNNMLRMSQLTFMLNEFRLSGNFVSAAGRVGTINGNAVVLAKSLTGQSPRIRLDATSTGGSAMFGFNLNNELQLLDNLDISGDGTQNFVINGVIKDYFAPRGVTKSGSSQVTLTAHNTFAGPLAVNGGRVRVVGAGAAINGASAISVGATGQLALANGLIRTGSITLAPGAQFQFESGTVEITGAGTNLGAGPIDVGVTLPGTLTLTAGAIAIAPTLRIGFNFDSQLNLAAGASLATQGNAAIAFNNAGAPTGSMATVSGAGALWNISGDLAVGQRGRATLGVANGGQVNALGAATLAAEAGSTATVTVGGASGLSQFTAASIHVGGGPVAGGAASLTINANGLVKATGPLAIRAADSVTLAGGELWVGELDNSHGGSFTWQSGKLRVTGPGGIAIAPGGPLGASRTVDAARPLEVVAATAVGAGGSLAVDGNFATGVLQLNGGTFTAPTLAGVGEVRFASGAFTLNGGTSANVTLVAGSVTGAAGVPEIVLEAGDSWSIGGTTTLPDGGDLTVDGGSFQTGVLHLNGGRFAAASLAGIGSLDFDLGELAIMGDVTIAAGGPLGATVDVGAAQTLDVGANLFVGTAAAPGSLTVQSGGAVNVVGATTIGQMGALTLAGGSLSTASLATLPGGSFTWSSGEIAFTGGLAVTAGADLGAAVTLDVNHSLRVANVLTIGADGAVTLDGGSLSVGGVTRQPGGSFVWNSGQLEITGVQGLLIGSGGLVGDTVVLSAGDGLAVTHGTSIAAGGALTVDGGTFATGTLDMVGGAFTAPALIGVGALSFTSGAIALTGPNGVTLGAGGTAVTAPIVLHATHSLTVAGMTTLATGAALHVDGGTFTSGALTLAGGTFTAASLTGVGPFTFQSGSLVLSQNLTIGPGGELGDSVALLANQSLQVGGTTTIATLGSLSVAGGEFATGVLKLDGGTASLDDLAGVGAVTFLSGSLTITGAAGATVGAGGVLPPSLTLDAGKALHVTATTNLTAGGALTIADGAFSTGVLDLNGGVYTASDLSGVGAVEIHSGTMALTGPGGATIGPGTPLGAAVTLGPGATLQVAGTTNIVSDGALTVAGGALSTDVLAINGGTYAAPDLTGPAAIQFTLGTLALSGDHTIAAGGALEQVLGGQLVVGLGRRLTIGGTATLAAATRVGGGRLSVGQLVNPQLLDFDAGTLDLTATNLVVGAGGLFGPVLTVSTGTALNVNPSTTVNAGSLVEVQDQGKLASTTFTNNGEIVLQGLTANVETTGVLTNAGAIRGTGRVGGPFVNVATGWVQAAGGERLRFLGPTFQNLGQASAIGTIVAPAELEFAGAVANAASTGLITGANARIRFDGGLTNEGSLALTGGDNHVFGAIANDNEVVVTGGATATFYGDVTNDGLIRVSESGSTNSVVVFLGAVTGNGGTTGGGDVFIEGDLRPGQTLAAATFGNDVHFGAQSTIEIDLAGTTPGTGYDQINVLGSLQLGGMLAVSLQSGFAPQLGQAFEIINAVGGLTGTFADVSLPSLTGNLSWQVAYDVDSVSLLVLGEQADFNIDGHVDGFDFLAWQRNLGTTSASGAPLGDANGDRTVNAADLAIWRNQFGPTPTALAAASAAAVPEPTSAALVTLACLMAHCIRRRERP